MVRKCLIGVGLIGGIVALGALSIAPEVLLALVQIDAWSRVKYQATLPPADLPIEIVAQQFEWRIRYPSSRRFQSDPQLVEDFARESAADQGQADDLRTVNELHIWKGGNVRVHLKSADVLHSFFVPMLRIKQEAVPGKVADVWLAVDRSNITWDAEAADWKQGDEWAFSCAEHSGQGPTKMRGRLFVHETKDAFLKWLEQAEKVRLQPPKGRGSRR